MDTFRPERKIRLATYASRCVENEVLMYFRSRKAAGEVSLSDTIDRRRGGRPQPHGRGGLRRHHASDMADREERLRIRELVAAALRTGRRR